MYEDQGIFEDTGDVGNEYIFRETAGDGRITTETARAEIYVKEDTPWKAVYGIDLSMEIPCRADDLLYKEQVMVTDSRKRQILRGRECMEQIIHTELSMEKGTNYLDVKIIFDNQAEDHRVRVLFPTDLQTSVHRADSVFEVVTRSNRHSDVWKNPSKCEHQQYFVAMCDEKGGILVANQGQYEYEILHDRNTIAVTLLRAVGEMGDWGYFPTTEAQCRRITEAKLRWVSGKKEDMEYDGFAEAQKFQIGFTSKQISVQKGRLPLSKTYLNWHGDGMVMTGYKAANDRKGIIARFVKQCKNPSVLEFVHPGKCFRSNVIEEQGEEILPDERGIFKISVRGCEIVTLYLCADR